VTDDVTLLPPIGKHRRKVHFSGPSVAIGFGLGGFFDGILLHQILQWHHLLSGVNQLSRDPRALILGDGLFHLAAYLVTVIGLWLLWRGRGAATLSSRLLIASVLLGFGLWHVIDAIVSHWLLGIHRVRMDVDNPLIWDLLWLAAFGVFPLIISAILRAGDRGSYRVPPAGLLTVLVLVMSTVASLPGPTGSPVTVMFRPDVTPQQALRAIISSGARVMGTDASGQLWVVTAGDQFELYRQGALFVSNSALPFGCLNRIRA
jgi:uncharacterized membrane protein